MKKITKKISAILCSFTMVFSSASAFMANAGDISDTPWTSGFDYCRRKWDATSVYVKNSSDYHYSSASVYGEDTINGDEKKDVNYFNGTRLATENLTLPARSERQIRQFVNERHINYVHIYFSGDGYGVWSPDSSGSYTLAN